MKTILLTGIGGDIGQAIARILQKNRKEWFIIGSDIHSRHAGSLYCHRIVTVPKADAPNYLDEIRKLITNEDIDLVLPVTEAELGVFLPLLSELGGDRCITAGPNVIRAGLDKLNTANVLAASGIDTPWSVPAIGVPPALPCIFKNRSGSGSKVVHIIETEIEAQHLSQLHKDAIYQELLGDELGEVTCAVYRDRSGKTETLSMLRQLSGGLTVWAQTIDDSEIRDVCNQVAEALDLRGSMNVQLRLTENGPRIFEINPRFSSTVEIRHALGFSDLLWALDEAEGKTVQFPRIEQGHIAVRTNGAAVLVKKEEATRC